MVHPQCAALAAAMAKSGKTDAEIAGEVHTTEAHLADILVGRAIPTADEFTRIAVALGIRDAAPQDAAHRTRG